MNLPRSLKFSTELLQPGVAGEAVGDGVVDWAAGKGEVAWAGLRFRAEGPTVAIKNEDSTVWTG